MPARPRSVGPSSADVTLAVMVRGQLAEDRETTAPARDDRVRAALAVCGKYRDPRGETRVAQNHDRHLDDAYGSGEERE